MYEGKNEVILLLTADLKGKVPLNLNSFWNEFILVSRNIEKSLNKNPIRKASLIVYIFYPKIYMTPSLIKVPRIPAVSPANIAVKPTTTE